MKMKQAALFAIMGEILSIITVVLNIFVPYPSTFLINSSIRIVGSVLMVMFFYVFLTRQKENASYKIAGSIGLVGCLIIIILNVLSTISQGIISIVNLDPLKHISLINIASLFRGVNFIVSLIPTVLMLICFMIIFKRLNRKSHLKKAALLASVGQVILFAEWTINLVLNLFHIKGTYAREGIGSLVFIPIEKLVVGLASPILLSAFFIMLYREMSNNENRIQLDIRI
ncbi:MAG: hypothetical protein K0R09_2718 [Clostridiales bacterium]|jgi:preprotein translocase subunit YajC|nr:hypothetical protein [Clostridiales bacterium]